MFLDVNELVENFDSKYKQMLRKHFVKSALDTLDEQAMMLLLSEIKEGKADVTFMIDDTKFITILNKLMYNVVLEIVEYGLPVMELSELSSYNEAMKIFSLDESSKNKDCEHRVTLANVVSFMIKHDFEEDAVDSLIKYCEPFIKDPNVINVILSVKREAWAEKLVRASYAYSGDYIACALKNKCFDFALFFFKDYDQSIIQNDAMLLDVLYHNIKEDFLHTEIYIFFLLKYIKLINFGIAKRLLEVFEERIDSPPDDNYFLLYSRNPIKICVLIIEILRKLKIFQALQMKCQKIEQDLLRIAMKVQEPIDEEEQMRKIFFDKDLSNREVIFISSKLNLIELFNHKLMEDLISELWIGPYVLDGHILSTSSSFSTLTTSFSTTWDIERVNRFKWQRKVENIKHHSSEFLVWRDGLFQRFLIRSVFWFATALFFQIEITSALSTGREIFHQHTEMISEVYHNITEEGLQSLHIPAELIQTEKSHIDIAITATYIFLALPLHYLMQHIYMIKTRRKYSWLTTEAVLDLGIFVSAICIQILLNVPLHQIHVENEGEVGEVEYLLKYYITLRERNTNYLFSSLMVFFWLRVMFIFKVNRILGPFLKIIYSMLKDIAVFLVIFGINLFAFSVIADLLLIDNTEEAFDGIYRSAVTLFQGALGVFNYKDLQQAIIGEIFMTIFLIINCIMLLNFLIAILTNTYMIFNQKSVMLYLNEIASMKVYYMNDDKYGCMISLPFPLDVVCVTPCLPFLLSLKDPQRLNKVLLKLMYMPLFIVCLLFYVSTNIALMPVCFVYAVLHKFSLVFRNNADTKKMKVLVLLMFLVFGAFILVMNLFIDTYFFTKSMFRKEANKKFLSGKSNIWKHTYMTFISHINTLRMSNPKKKSKFPYKDIFDTMKLEFNILSFMLKNKVGRSLKKNMLDTQNSSQKSLNDPLNSSLSKGKRPNLSQFAREHDKSPTSDKTNEEVKKESPTSKKPSRSSTIPHVKPKSIMSNKKGNTGKITPYEVSKENNLMLNSKQDIQIHEYSEMKDIITRFKIKDETGSKFVNLDVLFSVLYSNILIPRLRRKLTKSDEEEQRFDKKRSKYRNSIQFLSRLDSHMPTRKAPSTEVLYRSNDYVKLKRKNLIFYDIKKIIQSIEIRVNEDRQARVILSMSKNIQYMRRIVEKVGIKSLGDDECLNPISPKKEKKEKAGFQDALRHIEKESNTGNVHLKSRRNQYLATSVELQDIKAKKEETSSVDEEGSDKRLKKLELAKKGIDWGMYQHLNESESRSQQSIIVDTLEKSTIEKSTNEKKKGELMIEDIDDDLYNFVNRTLEDKSDSELK